MVNKTSSAFNVIWSDEKLYKNLARTTGDKRLRGRPAQNSRKILKFQYTGHNVNYMK